MVESQRIAVLMTLDGLGQQIENLRKQVEFYQELAACESWTALEAVRTATPRMGEEWARQLVIDRKIRQMDTDYSFSGEIWNEPLPSLCGQEHPM